jgi:pimeloyl-ACP methyl ester carboxylesterase
MTRTRLRIGLPIVFAGLLSGISLAQGPFTFVTVDGVEIHARQDGYARKGVPTVVFENGLGTPLVAWLKVQDEIAKDTRTITYDRAGIGRSKASDEEPTPAHIARRLRALLAQLGAQPPYVLVGHSYGGPQSQFYAATYPGEVAGLVLVDPTDAAVDMKDVWTKAGVPGGPAWEEKAQLEGMAKAPAGVQAEVRQMMKDQKDGFSVFRGLAVPDVPIGIVVAGRLQRPPGTTFPGDFELFSQAIVQQRLDHFGETARRAKNGFMVLSGTSGHFVQVQDPDTVIWAIRRVLKAATPPSP